MCLFSSFILQVLLFISLLSASPLLAGSPEDVCVVDMWIGQAENFKTNETLARIRNNHQSYAACQGYTYVHQTVSLNETLTPHWTKMYLIRDLLQTKCASVLWIDFDALFMHCKYSIEHLLSSNKVNDEALLIFSGDTNIINSGVMIFRRSPWSIQFINTIISIGHTPGPDPSFKGGLGMGYENTAFAIALVGCKPSSTQSQREECYKRSDYAYIEKEKGNKESYLKMTAGDREALDLVLVDEFKPYVHILPQSEFNSYKVRTAKFIVHFPSQKKRMNLLHKIAERMICECDGK